MADPITGAIAQSVTTTAVEEVVGFISDSDEAEDAWKRSCQEVAIQIKGAYQSNCEIGDYRDEGGLQEAMGEYAELAVQLAIRGRAHGFDPQYLETFEEFVDGCLDIYGTFITNSTNLCKTFEEEVLPYCEQVIESAGVGPA